jgi:hypothetical protein
MHNCKYYDLTVTFSLVFDDEEAGTVQETEAVVLTSIVVQLAGTETIGMESGGLTGTTSASNPFGSSTCSAKWHFLLV